MEIQLILNNARVVRDFFFFCFVETILEVRAL